MTKKIGIYFHRTRDAGEFEESKHPRAENGQFGKGSGGGKAASAKNELRNFEGSEAKENKTPEYKAALSAANKEAWQKRFGKDPKINERMKEVNKRLASAPAKSPVLAAKEKRVAAAVNEGKNARSKEELSRLSPEQKAEVAKHGSLANYKAVKQIEARRKLAHEANKFEKKPDLAAKHEALKSEYENHGLSGSQFSKMNRLRRATAPHHLKSSEVIKKGESEPAALAAGKKALSKTTGQSVASMSPKKGSK